MTTTIRYPVEADASNFKRGMAEAKEAARAASGAMEEWTKTNQRAAMRMEAMHEEALKLNNAFKSGSDSTQRNAETLRAFATALPIPQTQAMSATLGLADLGFKNLTTSAVGFNAASAGVVGAGLAIGTTIGSWLRTFPAVQQTVDDLAASVVNLGDDLEGLAGGAGDTRSIEQFSKDMNAVSLEAFDKVLQRMVAQGKTIQEVSDLYNGQLTPAMKTAAQVAKELADVQADISGQNKKMADSAREAARAQAEVFAKGTAAATNAYYQKQFETAEKALTETLDRVTQAEDQKATAAISKVVNDRILKMAGVLTEGSSMGLLWERMGRQLILFGDKGGKDAGASFKKTFSDAMADLPNVILGAIQGGGDVFQAIGASLGGALGKGLGESLAKMLPNTLGKALGSIAGPLGSLLGGGLGSLFGKLFGGSEEKKVNPMRQEFVDAAGGLEVLNKKAHDAGLTLDRMLNAKTVKEYQAAIDELNGALGLQAKATEELDAAAQKYGFTTQNMADTMGGELLKNWQLLNAAGFDHAEILKRMAPDLNEYVQTAIKAGQAIPENFRPIIEEMIKMGLLTDENGKAFGSLEEAGITFTESLTDGLKSLIEEIHKLVAALTGVPDALPNYSQGGGGAGANPPAHGGPRGGEHFDGGGYQAPGPESLNWTGSGSGEYHVPGGPDWMSRLAAELGPYLNGGGSQTMAGKLEVDLKRGVGELVAEAYSNNEGGVRQTIRRDLGLT